jgi:lipoic acid synthetase
MVATGTAAGTGGGDRAAAGTTPPATAAPLRKPPWLRARIGGGEAFLATAARLRANRLPTVCEEAACPNRGHCWARGRATVLLLGDRCTRGCRFCNVGRRPPRPPAADEPARVARAARDSGWREIVLTSVTRDDLPDGGAAHWAATITAVRAACPEALIEALVPDFAGDAAALALVLAARPAILGHNLETVPRLYDAFRPQAGYRRSLGVLRQAAAAGIATKTGLMLGMGERRDELLATLAEARAAGVAILSLGQYLQPSPRHLPVARYLPPAEFEELAAKAREMGFGFVAAGPLVRSSYHDEGQTEFLRRRQPPPATTGKDATGERRWPGQNASWR